MSDGKKMALVPVEMLETMMNNSTLTALQNPNKDQLLKPIESVNILNEDNDLPDNVKANRQARNLKEMSVMASKLIPKPSTLTRDDTKIDNDDYETRLEHIPKTYQRPAKAILRELKHHSNRLQIDKKTNEVTIDGEKLAHSNLIDLISDVVRPRKTALPPLHASRFLRLLADINIPEQLIGNKIRIKDMRNYKSKDRSAQDERQALLTPDESELEDFPRQWRVLQRKQTIQGLQKGKRKRNLRSKPYLKKAKYDWKTI